MSESKNADQRLRDRKQQEYTQAKGHNRRIREVYPDAWATSTITDRILADWIIEAKKLPCKYCNKSPSRREIDHQQPLARGGSHSLDNLALLCFDCNRSKSDKTDKEFWDYLALNPIREPYRPDPGVLRPEGRFRTRSLFQGPDMVWDLDDYRQLYLDCMDPTEYRFALETLGSWKHWLILSKQRFLKKWLREVRQELRVKIRSLAVQRLISTENLAGVKILATEDIDFVNPQPVNPVGRPPKQPETPVDDTQDVQDDIARINRTGSHHLIIS